MREVGAQRVVTGDVRPQLSDDVRDHVHDVRVALDGHQRRHLHGAGLADAAEVVTGEVD